MISDEQFEVTIPSDTTAGQRIQERIVGLLEERAFSARDVFGMRLALEEALVNAIKHGNRFDPDKSVRVVCSVTADHVRVEIEDEGPGFDPGDVPDPTLAENLDRPSGRGILLMRNFMTHVSFNETGNRIHLQKNRSNEDD